MAGASAAASASRSAATCGSPTRARNSAFPRRVSASLRRTRVKKLMDLVGPAHTKEIFFTARHFSAAEALAMGLVNRVVPEPS